MSSKTNQEKQAFADGFFSTCDSMNLGPHQLAAVVKVAASLSTPIRSALAEYLDGASFSVKAESSDPISSNG